MPEEECVVVWSERSGARFFLFDIGLNERTADQVSREQDHSHELLFSAPAGNTGNIR